MENEIGEGRRKPPNWEILLRGAVFEVVRFLASKIARRDSVWGGSKSAEIQRPVCDQRFHLIEELCRSLKLRDVLRLDYGDLDLDYQELFGGFVVLKRFPYAFISEDLRRRAKRFASASRTPFYGALFCPTIFIADSGEPMTMEDLPEQFARRRSARVSLIAAPRQKRDEVQFDGDAFPQRHADFPQEPFSGGSDVVHAAQRSSPSGQSLDALAQEAQVHPLAGAGRKVLEQLRLDAPDLVGRHPLIGQRRLFEPVYQIFNLARHLARDLFCAVHLFFHTWTVSTAGSGTWNDWGVQSPSVLASPRHRRRARALIATWTRYVPLQDAVSLSFLDLLCAREHSDGTVLVGRDAVAVPRMLVRATKVYHLRERERIGRMRGWSTIFIEPDGSPTTRIDVWLWRLTRSRKRTERAAG